MSTQCLAKMFSTDIGIDLGTANCLVYVRDMGIVLAILSSYRNQVIDGKTICFGEIGLVGEVRAVSMAEARVQEAAKLGFERCILPEVNRRQLDLEQMDLKGLKLIGISNVYELLEIL